MAQQLVAFFRDVMDARFGLIPVRSFLPNQRLNRYCASSLAKCLLRLSSVTCCLLSLYPQRPILSDAVLLEVLFHH